MLLISLASFIGVFAMHAVPAQGQDVLMELYELGDGLFARISGSFTNLDVFDPPELFGVRLNGVINRLSFGTIENYMGGEDNVRYAANVNDIPEIEFFTNDPDVYANGFGLRMAEERVFGSIGNDNIGFQYNPETGLAAIFTPVRYQIGNAISERLTFFGNRNLTMYGIDDGLTQGLRWPGGSITYLARDNFAAVTGFVLVRSRGNTDIGPLEDGDSFVQVTRSNDNRYNVRAEVDTTDVRSVVFELNGEEVQIENVAPYALGGDIDGNYFNTPEFKDPGFYTLTATPYSESDGNGEPGRSLTVQFEILAE